MERGHELKSLRDSEIIITNYEKMSQPTMLTFVEPIIEMS